MTEATALSAELVQLADLITPMAVRVAATLRLADRIADGVRTPAALAAATGADKGALYRLLQHLAGKRILARDECGAYSLTDLGSGLLESHPGGTRALLDIDGALGRADLSLVQLLHSVRTGEAAFPVQFGRRFWEYIAADAGLTSSFDALMGRDAAAWAAAVVPAYAWGAVGHVVDVGGGNGTLIAAMLEAHPGLRGTVVDQPATAAAARALLAERGLSGRCDTVAGSFFDPLPAGAGGYILCAILHDWDDVSAIAILRRCAEAAGRHGAVFVIEKTGGNGESVSTAMDLRLLAYFAGHERGITEIGVLAVAAGLQVASTCFGGDIAIVELRVPPDQQ